MYKGYDYRYIPTYICVYVCIYTYVYICTLSNTHHMLAAGAHRYVFTVLELCNWYKMSSRQGRRGGITASGFCLLLTLMALSAEPLELFSWLLSRSMAGER